MLVFNKLIRMCDITTTLIAGGGGTWDVREAIGM